ncbi:hypothetical protein [Chlamydia psittaci]|uniref:hypothetical protein n=1 Tax=Chlamydia psittaci TaxID=83554 RepID=UPI00027E1EE7|nr:hypothetical protein [Chlamydia psittaci]AFS25006.1 hypothetical protein B602_0618 [Chlamydia psittaci M56]
MNDEESDDDEQDLTKDVAFSSSFTYGFVKQNTRNSKNTVTCTTASHFYILCSKIVRQTQKICK